MIPRIIPPGTGVTLDGLLLIDCDEDAEGDGEGVGDALASFSRCFLIFMITLTGGGAKRWALEHPARMPAAIISVAA